MQHNLRCAIPIVDTKIRVIGVCCGRPDDDSWANSQESAADTIDVAHSAMNFSKKDLCHRHADTPAGAVGVSYGGGQRVSLLTHSHTLSLTGHHQVPGLLVNYGVNALIYASLLSNTDIIRIAGFASGSLYFVLAAILMLMHAIQLASLRGHLISTGTMRTTSAHFI